MDNPLPIPNPNPNPNPDPPEDASSSASTTTTTTTTSSPTTTTPVSVDDDQRVYFVPLRWWKEAQEPGGCPKLLLVDGSEGNNNRGIPYTATSAFSYGGPMKIINNIFNSDLSFNLKKLEDGATQEDDQNGGGGDQVTISGRDFALVPGEMWLQALKWHSNSRSIVKEGRSFSAAEDAMSDVYPLQLRLSLLRDTNTLGIRISKKDNALEHFRRACKIFNVESELLRIWDFSGQTTLFFLNDKNRCVKDSQRQSEQDILLELQVYGLSDIGRNREGKKDESQLAVNGSGRNSFSLRSTSAAFLRNSCEAGSLGLTGLQNLGNTCFMNSALQCLAHTPKLVDYFLGDYRREINHDNPLGMNGEIASAFGDLMKVLWAPGATTVPPRTFKSKLAHFAPQFSGFNQHDSQELLAFLLDGLHEDLNRVKCKPYSEAKDGDGRSDEDVADEYWQNHLARNDSIIVDICQGQYKSTLVCPLCKKVSTTFDPFMYLSLPLPSTSMRTMSLTVVNSDGSKQPSPYIITVPKHGKFQDLIQSLSSMCSLGVDETLLVTEVYNNHIIRFLGEPADSLSLIRDDDRLVAYRIQKDFEKLPLVVFMHQQMDEAYGMPSPSWKSFGIPLVASSEVRNGLEIRDLYLKVLRPFAVPTSNSKDSYVDTVTAATETAEVTGATCPGLSEVAGQKELESQFAIDLQFYWTDEKGKVRINEIAMNEPVSSRTDANRLYVIVCWPDKMAEQYDKNLLSSLPEIFKSGLFSKRPQESVSLYKCLEAFIKEEPLGPEDMWFCPGCKIHCQASKKLDLWRLPEILVIHLKRFSYNRYLKNKLETYIDFPVRDLDLSTYIAGKSEQSCNRYMLYAISNHYGSMGGGHYTAFVRHDGDRWYDFDDSHVSPISEDRIKTSAAYVLFYRRVEDE